VTSPGHCPTLFPPLRPRDCEGAAFVVAVFLVRGFYPISFQRRVTSNRSFLHSRSASSLALAK
jgi:hypothetical protein